jgi:hypothetical protein
MKCESASGRRKGKTRLVVRDGKIGAESSAILNSEDEVEAVTLSFRTGIQPNGALTRFTLRQGSSDIRLTMDQAKSLIREIGLRVKP